MKRKDSTIDTPPTTTPVATDWRQVLRVMLVAALVVVLLLAALAALALPRGWLRDENPVNVFTMAVLIVLGVASVVGWRALVNVWRSTWPGAEKPVKTARRQRTLPINGEHVPFGLEDDELVPGIDWPLAKVQTALAWAQRHGLTDGAWANGPLSDSELRRFREFLNANKLAHKKGSARTAPWVLDADLQEALDIIERL